MSEKVRSLHLSSAVGSASGVGPTTLIGNPTLISSTLSTNHNLTPTIDLITAAASHTHITRDCSSSTPSTALNTSLNSGSDMESSSEFAPGTITAQLQFQLIPNVVDNNNATNAGSNSTTVSILDYNSIMNSSQFSAISNDSLQVQQQVATQQQQQQQLSSSLSSHVNCLSSNSMALVKAGAGKPVVAQSVAGVS